MKNVIVFGGTGFIGNYLTEELSKKKYNVIIVTRTKWLHNKVIPSKNVQYKYWDIENGYVDNEMIQNANYIVNLSGENIAKGRWTQKTKNKIVGSRVKAGELIFKALAETVNKVECVINASAIGWYGENDTKTFVETDPPANDFLGVTCQKWENSISPIADINKRLVIFRMGLIFSRKGGVLRKFKKLLYFGIAPIFGKGNQFISWIHIDDFIAMILFAIEHNNVNGVYNAVSPNPISARYLISTMQRMNFFPTFKIFFPKWLIKLIIGEMSVELLKSCKVSSKKVEQVGFKFKYKHVETAVQHLLREG